MGGKGSGGARPRSGPKPKSPALAIVHGSRGASTRPVVDAGAVEAAAGPLGPVDCPADLPAEQRAVWEALAPQALERRTLTLATALAFRDLCEAIVVKRDLLAIIQKDGYTITKVTVQMDESGGGLQLVEPKAHPLLSQFRGMMQRVETGLARFRLTGDGKAIEADAKPVELSPLQKLQAQAKAMRGK